MDRTRFKDAPWIPQENDTCLVGGCGGIGSYLSFFLSRAGFNPIVYDFDTVEEVNRAGQMFRKEDIGKYKTEALNDMLEAFCDMNITSYNTKIDENTMSHYFMFSAFDNMKARKDFFEVWKKGISNCAVTPIYIDGRLQAEQLQIFCVTPENMEEYEKEHLFEDHEVAPVSCTMKQTSHVAAMIASLMMGFFTNHITNIHERDKIREIPFYYEYFIPLSIVNQR